MKGRRRFRCAVAAVAAVAMAGGAAWGGQSSNDGAAVGLDDLTARLGAGNVPTGSGVVVGQTEFPDGQGDYTPTEGLAEFLDKCFCKMSGASNTSLHANNVANNFYGLTLSIAPGITDVFVWEVNDWIGAGFLGVQTVNDPLPLPASCPTGAGCNAGIKIFNHSWVASYGVPSLDNQALRRLDDVITRDDLVLVAGVNNKDNPPTDGQNVALLSHLYNGIIVGVADGTHVTDPTLGTIDGPGRMKPEIVAPGTKVSWAIPVVSAGAALLVETARASASLGSAASERSEVIKAILMAGANHRTGSPQNWTNNPSTSGPDRGVTTQPLDEIRGVDLLDVNVSHLILTAGRQPGLDSVPALTSGRYQGWDLASVGLGESRYWRLSMCDAATEVSVIATWHRRSDSPFGAANWAVADFDLFLWRADGGGLATLVGDDGLAYFGGGNVTSESAADNVEHLFVTDLAAGDYVLELRRQDALATDPSWDAGVAWTVAAPAPPLGDVTGDCHVGVDDFLEVLAQWGPCPAPCPPSCPADLNDDCTVGVDDFLLVLGNWAP